MAFTYQPPPPVGSAVSQGEILWEVIEHRNITPAIDTRDHFIRSTRHRLAVVVTQGCDLERDWELRQAQAFDESMTAVPFILLCSLLEEGDIRNGPPHINSTLWSRIKDNQNERYHHLPSAAIESSLWRVPDPSAAIESSLLRLPDLYTDFRKPLALSSTGLYAGIASLKVARLAVIPPVVLHDFIHRFYAFQSRVAVTA